MCGNNNCSWILIILVLLCCCGGFGSGYNGCKQQRLRLWLRLLNSQKHKKRRCPTRDSAFPLFAVKNSGLGLQGLLQGQGQLGRAGGGLVAALDVLAAGDVVLHLHTLGQGGHTLGVAAAAAGKLHFAGWSRPPRPRGCAGNRRRGGISSSIGQNFLSRQNLTEYNLPHLPGGCQGSSAKGSGPGRPWTSSVP